MRLSEESDLYLGVSFLVSDLARVRAHLTKVGVPSSGTDEVVIEPEDGFGAQWRFIAELPYPVSERRVARF